jgi:hypothetical protein
MLLALAAGARAMSQAPERGDDGALAQFVFVLIALAGLTRIPVPGLPLR